MSGQLSVDLLPRCTVKLSVPGRMGHGTGFFVAPGLILTCAHVVKDAGNKPIQVEWQHQEDFAEAFIDSFFPDPFDLALLGFNAAVPNLPCVYLDESVQPDDSLYSYGYPDDFPQGGPVTLECEGFTGDNPPLLKFKAGQVRPGLSGAPLLNQRTGKVCGIVKFTRDRSIDLGGGAVPATVIFAQFPELEAHNREFHQRDTRWTKLLPRPSTQTHLTRQEYQNRQILLNKVRNYWVKGVLDTSLHGRVLIELGLEERLDAVDHPWGMVWETPDQMRQTLLPGTRVIDKFDEMGKGRSLLILGEPGSGKTMTLLELARNLIDRAEQDITQPIPVVFNLSAWAKEKPPIADWLIEELNTKYQVSREIGKAWVKAEQLLLLLDGLDEVSAERREACVQAINHFSQEHGATEIVVCSRIKDYEALSNRLRFQGAVFIQPLTLEQIQHYLASAGSQLAAVNTALQGDTKLQELARTPLILSIMTLAYQGISVEDLPSLNLEERRKHLLNAYIQQMFDRRSFEQQYSKEQAKRWLIWLAQRMFQQSQTVFLIERMQFSWLKTTFQKWLCVVEAGLTWGLIWGLIFGLSGGRVFGFSSGLIIAVVVGLIFGLTFLLEQLPPSWWQTTLQKWVYSTGTGVFDGLLFGLIVRLVNSRLDIDLIAGAIVTLIVTLSNVLMGGLMGLSFCHIEPVETLKWSWTHIRTSLIFWLILGLITGSIVGLMGMLRSKPILGLIGGLVFGLVFGLIGGLGRQGIATMTSPNQGIWQSAKNAIFVALTAVSVLGLMARLMAIQIFLGVIFGLWAGLYVGGTACIQHFNLRIVLYFSGCIPWNYARFLDYATERIFLQKVGGGYIFIHRLLLEHFAQL